MTRKTLLIVALLLMVVASVIRPRPANALSTTDEVIIAVGGAVAYVAIVYIGTQLAFPNEGQLMLPEERQRDLIGRYTSNRVHIGPECRMPDGQPALLCW